MTPEEVRPILNPRLSPKPNKPNFYLFSVKVITIIGLSIKNLNLKPGIINPQRKIKGTNHVKEILEAPRYEVNLRRVELEEGDLVSKRFK